MREENKVSKIRTFYTSGTLGDAYVILCKVYRIAKKEPISLKHYTENKSLKPTIREIYSLIPNIDVEFRDNEQPLGITGQFLRHKLMGKQMTYIPDDDGYGLEMECHPQFNLGNDNPFGLPCHYVTMQLESGANPKKRRHINIKEIEKVISRSELPVVIIGNDSVGFDIENGIIDLRGKTSIKEVVKIIRDSHHFYGCLGLLSLVALSQVVCSTLYKPLYLKDKHAFESRIQPIAEWKRCVSQ